MPMPMPMARAMARALRFERYTISASVLASSTEIVPFHWHAQVESSVSAGRSCSVTCAAPGDHLFAVAGWHGMGVCTPLAALVALMTEGFVLELHMPKLAILVLGAW